MSWIAMSYLEDEYDRQFSYVDEVITGFIDLETSLGAFIQHGDGVLPNNSYDVKRFEDNSDILIGACKDIFYNLFRLADRIIYNPMVLADQNKALFEDIVNTLGVRMEEFTYTLSAIEEIVDTIEDDNWPDVTAILSESKDYLANKTRFKNCNLPCMSTNRPFCLWYKVSKLNSLTFNHGIILLS
ncbi:hypothetical protein CAPTEDRAFT_209269 [Capitella teleta]|uniref:Uncharacterized protein n=1 Tax=Capitella teleta TaxID=283909 RepID=R7U7N9_CAPTE|nr:hypothetical protein CAPTEDRAFT_209269 [Capitella teleta]|eukprot:ELU02166.1 hypothetical protein CAPTEDRAFT_209269 [Capitella teleta]